MQPNLSVAPALDQHTANVLSTFVTELNQLTGVAAILTFPLDVEVVEAEEQAAKDEAQGEAGDT